MSWELLIPIIAKYGLPLAEALWKKVKDSREPTAEDWAELRLVAYPSPRDYLIDALGRANISLDDPRAKELLSHL